MSTNLVLTARKAISLCFSVWWFGNGWNAQLGVGAGMVFLGSLLYTVVTSRGSGRASPKRAVAAVPSAAKTKTETEMEMEMVGTHEDGGRSHTRRLGNREERPGDAR